MDRQSQSNGLETFLEHWGLLISAIIAVVSAKVLNFFTGLSSELWMWFLVSAFGLMVLGGAFIVYAKMPAYRSRRFFGFGLQTVPEALQGYYLWGWRTLLFGVVLGLLLLLPRS